MSWLVPFPSYVAQPFLSLLPPSTLRPIPSSSDPRTPSLGINTSIAHAQPWHQLARLEGKGLTSLVVSLLLCRLVASCARLYPRSSPLERLLTGLLRLLHPFPSLSSGARPCLPYRRRSLLQVSLFGLGSPSAGSVLGVPSLKVRSSSPRREQALSAASKVSSSGSSLVRLHFINARGGDWSSCAFLFSTHDGNGRV